MKPKFMIKKHLQNFHLLKREKSCLKKAQMYLKNYMRIRCLPVSLCELKKLRIGATFHTHPFHYS